MNAKKLQDTAERVADRLMHLGGAAYGQDKNRSPEEIREGNVARDFGIEEWDWPQGVGLYGLVQHQSCMKDGRYRDFLRGWYERGRKEGLPSRNINTTAPYLPLTELIRTGAAGFDDPQWETLCREQADWLMYGLPRTPEGGFQHVTTAIGDRNDVILNEGQLWVDTIFMALLFLEAAGRQFDVPAWQQESLRQLMLHLKYLYDRSTGLFYHGYSFLRQDHFGGVHWCRGNGWFTLGGALYLAQADFLSSSFRAVLTDTYREHAAALVKLQAPSGLFHTILDDEESYEEVSGSAAIAAGLFCAVRTGLLDRMYLTAAERALEGVCRHIGEDGTVGGVSAGTGMGMDAEHYRRIRIRPMAYGQALALIALCEGMRAAERKQRPGR